ncbi:hypothetical protein AALB16_02520 [Lachnospiraceae bacterium 62-35]
MKFIRPSAGSGAVSEQSADTGYGVKISISTIIQIEHSFAAIPFLPHRIQIPKALRTEM